MSGSPIEIEKTNLEVHVDLCAQRYQSLDRRLLNIEEKFAELGDSIKNNHDSMTRVLIGTAGTVIASLLAVLVAVLTK